MQPLDYFTKRDGSAPRASAQRIFLTLIYYLLWISSITLGLPIFVFIAAKTDYLSTLFPIHEDVLFSLTAVIGIVCGALIARASRNRRWTQYFAVLSGVMGITVTVYVTIRFLIIPKPYLWQLPAVLASVVLTSFLLLAFAGLSGLALSRERSLEA